MGSCPEEIDKQINLIALGVTEAFAQVDKGNWDSHELDRVRLKSMLDKGEPD